MVNAARRVALQPARASAEAANGRLAHDPEGALGGLVALWREEVVRDDMHLKKQREARRGRIADALTALLARPLA